MISIIIPVYNEENNLTELHSSLGETLSQLKDQSFEIVFVDDCSTDKSPEVLKELYQRDKRVKIIRFARNCGSHAALAAGLNQCQGECAITLAADLQDPPEIIHSLLKKWREGAKVVWGVRTKRKGEPPSVRFFSKIYYRLMNGLTSVSFPPSGADVFLADRAVIDAFQTVKEKHTSIFMTLAWMGFQQDCIDYVKEPRHSGESKWSLDKKIKLTVDSLLAFSDIPIRTMIILGFFTALVGFGYAFFIIFNHATGSPVEGWSSLIVAILIIGGVQMMMLGVLGEYLWRTYDESRKRPRYVIEYTIGK